MSEPVIPELGSIRKLPTWDSLRGGGYEVPLDEAMRIIDQFRAEVAEQAATIASIEREMSRHASIEEKAHLQTIDERDRAEEALSQAYYLITGSPPEWSNLFGHDEALSDIDDTQRCLRAEVKEQAATIERLRCLASRKDAPIAILAEIRAEFAASSKQVKP